MKPIKLDLKQFKHIKSDDKSTTLQHKDGHVLTIAHSVLKDKDARAQLEALKNVATDAQTPIQADRANDEKAGNKAAHPVAREDKGYGAVITKYAEGGQTGDQANLKENTTQRTDPKGDTGKCVTIREDKGWGAVVRCDAEGGEVTPPTQAPRTERTDPKANSPGKCVVLREDKGYGAIIHCYADGGKIPLAEGVNPKHCMNCGGKVHYDDQAAAPVKMAEGSTGGPLSDENPKPTTDFKPEIDDEIRRIMQTPAQQQDFTPSASDDLTNADKAYNTEARMEARGNASSALPVGMDPDVMGADTSFPEIQKHGEIPPNVSVPALKNAASDIAWDQKSAQETGNTQAAQEAEKAALLGKLGMQPQASSQGVADAQPQAAALGQPAPAAEQMPATSAVNPMDPESLYKASFADFLSGNRAEAKALGDLGKQQAIKADETTAALQRARESYDKERSTLDGEREALQADIRDGQVDPNKFWTGDKNGNGGHSKIMAGIGMILAGFNPTTNPNAAINFLKFQMEQNLTAQQRNLQAKESLLTANLKQYGNLKDAMDATRVIQNDIMVNELKAAAAKAQSPLANAAAMKAAGAFEHENVALSQSLAMRRAMMGLAGSGDTGGTEHLLNVMDASNPGSSKIYRERIVPGFTSVSGGPFAVKEVPQSVRDKLTAMQVLDSKGREVLGFINQNKNTLSPEKRAVIKQKVEEMKNFYNDSIGGGALTEGRLHWYDEQFGKGAPTDPLPRILGQTAKFEEMINSNASRMRQEAGAVGLKPHGTQQAATPQHADYMAWAKANPNNPKAQKYLELHGGR